MLYSTVGVLITPITVWLVPCSVKCYTTFLQCIAAAAVAASATAAVAASAAAAVAASATAAATSKCSF